jgi:hypothetical protein
MMWAAAAMLSSCGGEPEERGSERPAAATGGFLAPPPAQATGLAAQMAEASPCRDVISETALATLRRTESIDPVLNRITISRQGGIAWNGTPVDLHVLRQYLEHTQNVRPAAPLLVTGAEPGTDPDLVERVREIIFITKDCRPDSF